MSNLPNVQSQATIVDQARESSTVEQELDRALQITRRSNASAVNYSTPVTTRGLLSAVLPARSFTGEILPQGITVQVRQGQTTEHRSGHLQGAKYKKLKALQPTFKTTFIHFSSHHVLKSHSI